MLVGGAVGGTFIANYSCALIMPKLPASINTNVFVAAAIKLGTAAVAAKVVSRWSKPVAHGILLGGMLVVVNDMIRRYATPTVTTGSTGRYLSSYLGVGPKVGRNVQSLVGAVTPTRSTFAARKVGGIFGTNGAFKADAWAR